MVRTVAALVAVAGVGVFASSASALTAASGSLTMTSDAGDYIGQGLQYSYSTTNNDVFTSSSATNFVEIDVTGSNGDFWTLDFAAPAGQSLTAGTYTSATRYPFQGSGAGLSVYGNGRGCNTLTGNFTVSNISFGPSGYLQSFDASFEQHCEGAFPALRGQVDIVNPPAPQPLQIGLAVSQQATVSRSTGAATVSGTVTCNQPTTVYLSGTLSQRASRFAVAAGSYSTQVACSATPTRWQATVSSGNGVPFNPGKAQLDASASAFDPNYGQLVTATQTATLKLSG